MSHRSLIALAFLAGSGAFVGSSPATAQTSQDNYCYLVADNNGVRFDADIFTTIDKTSGLEVEVGGTGTLNIEAVAFNPTNRKLYAADGGLLGTIDITSGQFSPVGWLGSAWGPEGPISAGDVDGMTFDPSTGELYGSVRKADSDLLVKIDPSNGRVVTDAFGAGRSYVRVQYGVTDVDVDDIAISPLSGSLFAVVTDSDENSTLVTIDRMTGVASIMAPLSEPDLEGLSFDRNGRLFATPGGDGPDMVEVNIGTGVATAFASIGVGGNRDYEALSCMAFGEMSLDAEDETLPFDMALQPAYPNPFNPTTTLRFDLPVSTNVRLSVFDMLGREVQVLAEGTWQAGTHTAFFNARDLPSGLYMYRLVAPGFVATRTVTLLR